MSEHLDEPVVRKREPKTARNRSVTQFEGVLKTMVVTAATEGECITLFQDPLPDIKMSEEILAVVWRKTEIKI